MKRKVSRKEVNRLFDVVLRVPYCKAQSLLMYREPIFYNAGLYGWNFDVYPLGYFDNGESVAIVTGYRNLTGRFPEYVEEYERIAEETAKQYAYKANCRDEIENVLARFLEANEYGEPR